jgi:hypothetical protein
VGATVGGGDDGVVRSTPQHEVPTEQTDGHRPVVHVGTLRHHVPLLEKLRGLDQHRLASCHTDGLTVVP